MTRTYARLYKTGSRESYSLTLTGNIRANQRENTPILVTMYPHTATWHHPTSEDQCTLLGSVFNRNSQQVSLFKGVKASIS